MQKTLNENLDIIRNSDLEITLLDGDLNIIQKLDDEPNDVGGLTAAELKAKFDEAGNVIKTYINETLVPEILSESAVEAQRETNETQRETAESARQSAEEERETAESARQAAEEARETAESARQSAEEGRETAESARQAAEEERRSAESGRETAEAARVQAETARGAAEAERRSAETGRASAETARQSAEAARAAAEGGRETAETARASAEETRQAAESAREAAQEAFFSGVTASAQQLEEGAPPTATAAAENGSFHLELGIPAGGPAGKSAYQYAVDGGYTGTEAEFQSLMGSGPWLPAENGVVTGPVQIGDVTTDGILKIGGAFYGTLAALQLEVHAGEWVTTTLTHGLVATVSGAHTKFTDGVEFNDSVSFAGRVKFDASNLPKIGTKTIATVDDVNAVKSDLEAKALNAFAFSITGPIEANTEQSVSITGNREKIPSDDDSAIIYLGQRTAAEMKTILDIPIENVYRFELMNVTYNLWSEPTMTVQVNYKCLDKIPEGKTVNMVVVWMNGL